MAYTEIDLSTVLVNYGTATHADGVLTVDARSDFYFPDGPTLVAGQWLNVEITRTADSHRTLRIYSRLPDTDGNTSNWHLLYNISDWKFAERIGQTIRYSIGPDIDQYGYEQAVADGETALMFETWSSSNTGVADKITSIRYEVGGEPVTHRSVVLESFEVPCPLIAQGQSAPNAQATITDTAALAARGGSVAGMPYKAEGGSYQSPTLACLFSSANTIPAQFDADAEVRFLVRVRRTSDVQLQLSVEGHGNSTPVPYWNARVPEWPTSVPAALTDILSYPIANLAPDDLRTGRFGYPQSGSRMTSISLNSIDSPLSAADGAEIDYAAFVIRRVESPATEEPTIPADVVPAGNSNPWDLDPGSWTHQRTRA